jgi:UDP-glucuronate 4-epimerase
MTTAESQARPAHPRRERVVVTGAAGFLGSHLCEALLAEGCEVLGIDAFVGATPRLHAEENLRTAASDPRFMLIEMDLRRSLGRRVLARASTVFHLAARPGVRETGLSAFMAMNVAVTDLVLAAALGGGVRRFVFASSSSVYGLTSGRPSREDDRLAPASDYARSKALAESRCLASRLPAVVLRYFTVYGPRQRPDMAFARFIAATQGGPPAPIYAGSASAARHFTYVEDAVDGTLRAWRRGLTNSVYNIAGRGPTRLEDARVLIERLAGCDVPYCRRIGGVPEPLATCADLGKARRDLAYEPATALADGLRAQLTAGAPAITRRQGPLALGGPA